MAVFKKRKAAWDFEFRSTNGMVGRHMRAIAQRNLVLARQQVGVATGRLKSSLYTTISRTSKGVDSATIAPMSYAYLHHEGNGPAGGRIYPVSAKVLRFKYKGKIIYAESVRTARPNRFLTDNIRKSL